MAGLVDLYRDSPAATGDTDTLLRIAGECRDLLQRLVALEEERREGERAMEALADALTPRPEAVSSTLDWYRTGAGDLRVRTSDGDRPPSAEEFAQLAALGAVRPRRR